MSKGSRVASARVAAKSAVKIRAALAASIDARRVYTQYMDTNPPVTKDQVLARARARAWAMKNVNLDLATYKKVLARYYGDMYVLGQREALENMADRAQKGPVATANSKPKLNPQGLPIFDPSFTINWDAWTPGNEGAAALLSKPGGLKDLLGEIDIQARGIADYSHDLLGTALADGIARGDTPVTIANAIRDSLSSPERALTIAITEGQRAKISANLDSYQANNVEQIQWTVNDPQDADCLDNDGEIVNLGDEFPSGNTQPPVHPNCQCDVIPVMPDLSGTPEYADLTDEEIAARLDDSEMAVVADLAKYNPDQARDERGRFSSGGGGLEDKHGAEAASHAQTLYSHAKGIEPLLTQNMRDLADKHGTKLEGLDFRLKTQESLTSKIALGVKDGKTPAEVARTISDANRYTMVTDPANYRAAAEAVQKDLQNQGYDVRVKNYWQEGSNYKGVNMALTDPSGNRIELQFHTAESLAMKEETNHPIYKEYQKMDETTPEAQALNAQMVANSATLSTPPGLTNYGEPKIGKAVDLSDFYGYDRREGGNL